MSIAAKKRGAHNKGKVYCYNPETFEKKLCFSDEIPEGWIKGYVPKNK